MLSVRTQSLAAWPCVRASRTANEWKKVQLMVKHFIVHCSVAVSKRISNIFVLFIWNFMFEQMYTVLQNHSLYSTIRKLTQGFNYGQCGRNYASFLCCLRPLLWSFWNKSICPLGQTWIKPWIHYLKRIKMFLNVSLY